MKVIEVFKAGTHTDSEGKELTLSADELGKIANDYNGSEHEAPVVIGHPDDNAPAYGWVKSLSINGDKLMAELHQVQDEFKDWVNKGLYKKRSISFYADGSVRHVGFLGAQPPAIKGLTDFKFSSGQEYQSFELALENKNKEASDMTLEELQQQLAEMQKQLSETNTRLSAVEKERDDEKKRADDAEEKLKKTEGELNENKTAQVKKEISDFADSLVKDKKIMPSMKPQIISFAEHLENEKTFDFSEGSKTNPLDAFKKMLGDLPQIDDMTVDFSESAAGASAEAVETIKKGQV